MLMKKAVSFVLVLISLISVFSLNVFAAEDNGIKLSIAEVTSNSAKLTWESAKQQNKFYVYRATSAEDGFSKIADVKGNSYTDRGLAADTDYFYKVRGSRGSVIEAFSPFSEIESVHTEKEIVFSLSKTSVTLGNGEAYTLKIKSDNENLSVMFSSSDKSVVSVNSDGKIKALKEGKAVVTASCGSYEEKCTVTVKKAPQTVKLNKSKISIGVKDSYKLKVSFNAEETSLTRKFSSSDKSVATVNSSGVVTGKKTGTAVITVKAFNGVSAKCTVTVKKAPASVSLQSEKKTVFMNQTYTLKAAVPSGSACAGKTWVSSKPSVASVSSSGVVTPLKKGTTTITVTTYNGKTASCKITVKIVNYKKAYTAAQVRKDVKTLQQTYSSLIKTDVIGYSVKGSPIPLIKLGRGEKKTFVAAGIHSREYLTIGFTMRCVEEYAAAYYSKTGKYGDYDMVKLLDEYTLYIVPMSNPDGLDIVTNKKKTLYDKSYKDETYKRNANGVNLNRNFPFCWDKVTDGKTTKYENYKGKSAASEPETQALMALCENNNFEWLYSMHLYGNNVYWRDSKNGAVPGDEKLVNRLNKTCGFVKSPTTTDPNGYGGGFENWFRAKFNKPGFCVELVALDKNYRYEISRTKEFDSLTNWTKTRYAFIQGMI